MQRCCMQFLIISSVFKFQGGLFTYLLVADIFRKQLVFNDLIGLIFILICEHFIAVVLPDEYLCFATDHFIM